MLLQKAWPAILINMCSPELYLVLAKLYNKCLTKIFGQSKYRPISPLPINDSLTKHLDITGLFFDHQYGFLAFRSNADILTVLNECIYNLLDAGGVHYGVVVNMFDFHRSENCSCNIRLKCCGYMVFYGWNYCEKFQVHSSCNFVATSDYTFSRITPTYSIPMPYCWNSMPQMPNAN